MQLELRKILLVIFLFFTVVSYGQGNFKWLNAGSFQNFYSQAGCEVEEGRSKNQQDGWQWPAIFPYQDCQAAKGLWIGCTSFKEGTDVYPYRVVQVGPRLAGVGEFFPVKHKLYSKFPAPTVTVDGLVSYDKSIEIDSIDPNMKPDRMIHNIANTLIGLTLNRTISQFSNPQHDNYVIQDYTFTNTGNTNADEAIERADSTLRDVYIFFQYRWAPVKQASNTIANGTRWGMNTMIDARGDSVYSGDKSGENNYRTIFAWHGYFPDKTVSFDNQGAPIWYGKTNSLGYLTDADTVGRLGAPQFIGTLALYAQKSATDVSDDPGQPSTYTYLDSDNDATSGSADNNAYNPSKMQAKYEWMRKGKSKRHAYTVQGDGKFENQTGAPNGSTPGGYSGAIGFGPYTIPFGKSIRIVLAEGASGIDRDACISVGSDYKSGKITATVKNQKFLTGKDSLIKTWSMATKNFKSNGDSVIAPPKPPKEVNIVSKGDMISLSWSPFAGEPTNLKYRVYRATDVIDSTYRLITETAPGITSFNDTTNLRRGFGYYYYVVALNNGVESNRYYSQAYNTATLKRPAGTSINDIRVVPNPFILEADRDLRFGRGRENQIAFFGIPGKCTIKIFTELGELVNTIEHNDGSGDAYWNCITSSGQIVVSGLYIALVTNDETGEKKITKFVVIR